jgi:hypothetical protein
MAEPVKKGRQEGLPTFGGFSGDRLRIDRIIDRLDVTGDLVERADQASRSHPSSSWARALR